MFSSMALDAFGQSVRGGRFDAGPDSPSGQLLFRSFRKKQHSRLRCFRNWGKT